ncbi:MAG: hypothetical protein ACNYPE_14870 [Candidatus Azotimanducaceae bacterium WSBS_2022_MAG_OTU7]
MRSAQITIDEFDLPMTAKEFLAAREPYLETLFPEAEKEIPKWRLSSLPPLNKYSSLRDCHKLTQLSL